MRKEDMKVHMTGCQKSCYMMQPTSVLPSVNTDPSSPQQFQSETYPTLSAIEDYIAPSVSVEHSYTLPPSVSVLTSDHSYTVSQTASPKSPTITLESCLSPSATTSEPPTSHSSLPEEAVTTAAQTAKIMELPSSHVKCPHCSIVLYKKNLVLHIQRKHGGPKDITAASHLKSVCVDKSHSLYAVQKTSCGFSVPVHVQRKHGAINK